VNPAHTPNEPVIGIGLADTVNGFVAIQPVGSIYDITTDPAALPVTIPDTSIDAIVGSLLIQPPPGVALVMPVMSPKQIFDMPTIGVGSGLTVTSCVRIQDVGNVYVIIVIPTPSTPGVIADMPVITPVIISIEATDGFALLHVPPVLVLLNALVEPSHTCGLPAITFGNGFTVRITVALQPVPSA